MYDRSQQQQHVLSTFMKKEHEPNIPEEECEVDIDESPLQDSSSFIKPALNDIEQGLLTIFYFGGGGLSCTCSELYD